MREEHSPARVASTMGVRRYDRATRENFLEYRPLGRTGIKVSAIGLGTMTFGEQNTEAQAHEQLDYAFEKGVNLLDTAELYPVPPRAETYGSTERIIGTWLKRSGKRDKIVIATKIAGPGKVLGVTYLRGGDNRLDRGNIRAAVEASLQRLQTDYIDIYQLHWPSRPANFFGRLGYEHSANVEGAQAVDIEETLDALGELAKEGKIRHAGLSNETPWGIHRCLQLSGDGRPRIVSIQNPYSLLNRTFEVGLAEMAIREDVGLLAYSPLAFGVLSGKFLNGARPPEARMVRWARFSRYTNEQAGSATGMYAEVARKHGLDMAQMSLAFVRQQRFVTSVLIGATTMPQLRTNIGSASVSLGGEVLKDLEAVHRAHPSPCP